MYPTITREDRVKEFLDASKWPSFELVWTCFGEECIEMQQAALEYREAEEYGTKKEQLETRANLVKEIADVQYVLSQLALFYNVDLQTAFNRVANNNMTKVVDGKVIYREDGKILKPEGYVKADMTGL